MKQFTLGISVNRYNEKPVKFDNSIKYIKQSLTIEQLASYIKNGHVITHNFKDTFDEEFIKSNITIANFDYTYIVLIDVDDCKYNMNDFLSFVDIKPSLAYTTSSNINNVSNRFRIAYLFNKAIRSNEEYKEVANAIVEYFKSVVPNYEHNDNTCINSSQVMFGNPKQNIEIIYNDNTYDKDKFSVSFCIKEKREEHYTNGNGKKETEQLKKTITITDKEFIDDFFSITNKDSYFAFVEKYQNKYWYYDHTPIEDEYNEDIPFFKLPDNYISIKRYMCKDYFEKDNGEKKYFERVAKIKKGNRSKLLFVACILRKMMYKEVTFEHLLFCLLLDRQYFVDNTDKEVTNKKLFTIARNAFNSKETIKVEKDKRQYVVNKLYCAKYGISAKAVNNMIKKQLFDEAIGNVYDFSISVKENLKIMKEMGIKVSKTKLYDFYNEYSVSFCIKKKERNIIQMETENNNDMVIDYSDTYTFNSMPYSDKELYTMFMNDANVVKEEKNRNIETKTIEYKYINIYESFEDKDDFDWDELVGRCVVHNTNNLYSPSTL